MEKTAFFPVPRLFFLFLLRSHQIRRCDENAAVVIVPIQGLQPVGAACKGCVLSGLGGKVSAIK